MTEFQYLEFIKTLTIKELYDELISHVVGDDWDGMRSKTCQRELNELEKEFEIRMIELGVDWS